MANFARITLSGQELVLDMPTAVDFDTLGSKLFQRSQTFTERHLEDLCRENPSLFLGIDPDDPEESLLVIGQQVRQSGGRSDLVLVDGDGSLVLVELKRDATASVNRREPFEWQALRYAASYATIKSVEDAVRRLYGPYIARHKAEFSSQLGQLTTEELARRKIEEFLSESDTYKSFNNKQRIVLVAGSFQNQVLSACAWLVSNGVDISCVKVGSFELSGQYFVATELVLPAKDPSEFYVNLLDGPSVGPSPPSSSPPDSIGKATKLPGVDALWRAGLIKAGDVLTFRTKPTERARIVTQNRLTYQGREMSFNEWGRQVSGWSTINIYPYLVLDGSKKTLDGLRQELAASPPTDGNATTSASDPGEGAAGPLVALAGNGAGPLEQEAPHQRKT